MWYNFLIEYAFISEPEVYSQCISKIKCVMLYQCTQSRETSACLTVGRLKLLTLEQTLHIPAMWLNTQLNYSSHIEHGTPPNLSDCIQALFYSNTTFCCLWTCYFVLDQTCLERDLASSHLDLLSLLTHRTLIINNTK